MILISHRGNLNGPNLEKENEPNYILSAIKNGYNVEIDIWFHNKKWLLGHDKPIYEIDFYDFIYDNHKLWLHTKNIEALNELVKMNIESNIYWLKYFWHQNDDYTLTSNGYIWTYPEKKLVGNSICVLPEQTKYTKDEINRCYGICSDYIEKYK